MPKSRYRAAQHGGSADDVEAAFYEALQAGDIEQLMACWADEDDIVCVHPGGPRLVGAAAIRAAFEAMFANGAVRAHPERLRKVESLGAALHNVLERVDLVTAEGTQHAWVVATNPDGHPKLLHLWPVKLLQAGRSDGNYTGATAMREAASFSR